MSDREILKPLVERTLELAGRPDEARKKELWARLNALLPVEKIPVSLTFEGIPRRQWDAMFGEKHLRCQGELAREIEFYLKQRVWMAENVPDDHVIWPAVAIPAVYLPQHHQWGVELRRAHTDDELGSTAEIAPFAEDVDMARLRRPYTDVDEAGTATHLAEASELLDGRLSVFPTYATLGESPFEWAVKLRGMQQLFYDAYDNPQIIHALMTFVTEATLADHRHREAHGWINCPVEPSGRYQMTLTWRQIATYPLPDFDPRHPRICDERAYVSAQSAFGFGPKMFAEFVHPYNSRLAALFPPKSVYFHGCECLDQKLDVIATLPNLGRHHVSAWSNVALATEKYQGAVVLEVTTHPMLVCAGRQEMRDTMAGLARAAAGHPMTLGITDIYNFGGEPDNLRRWAEAAQDAVD